MCLCRILFEVPSCRKGDSFRLKKASGTQWTAEGLRCFLALLLIFTFLLGDVSLFVNVTLVSVTN